MMVDLRKFNKGRPPLTDDERAERQQHSSKKYKAKAEHKNLSINADMLKRLNSARDLAEKNLGFKITHIQMLSILLTAYDKTLKGTNA
tara:strand:- start:124 stop:387 length:264 start_codon:yes stop_codon:yes gene_type:complete